MSQDSKRKRTRAWIIVLSLVMLVVGAAAVACLVAWSKSGLQRGTVLEVHLDGPLTEGPQADFFAELGLGGGGGGSVWDLKRAVRRAASDDHIAGMLVIVEQPQMGLAQMLEVTDEIRAFGAAGKPVHVLLQTDVIGDGNYLAATSGTTVWVTPAAFWIVDGFRADVTFWRGTLDKLHVEPDVIMFKEYKSAGEPLSRHEMSEHFRESLLAVLVDVQEEWYETVAERRGMDPAAVEALVDKGMITGDEALSAKLVDEIGYLDQVKEALRQGAGTDEYTGVSVSGYLEQSDAEDGGDTRVAVVFGEGPVVSAAASNNPFEAGALAGPTVARAIRKAAEDDEVDAIVFRVNSPGGSAVGSDLVWREIENAQELGKPVVVSMSDVAGSGGYWVAMGADAIVAQPVTITGSIGVVFTKLDVRGFYEWIGANIDSVSLADNAGLIGPYDTFDEAQRATVVASIDVLYEQFKGKVAQGRGLSIEQVEEIARGRIWSGEDALALGLIDAVGGMDTAVRLAVEKAGGDPASVELAVYPEPESFFEMLLGGEMETSTPRTELLSADGVRAALQELEQPRAAAAMPDIRVY